MAEFPYPEYRNLWKGSKLSQDLTTISVSSAYSGVQTADGLQITGISDPGTGTFSLTYTPGAAVLSGIDPNGKYSWRIPFRNDSQRSLNLRVASWIRNSSGSLIATGVDYGKVWEPGEVKDIVIENMDAAGTGYDIRFSMYYGSGVDRPGVGDSFTILDGITLVQSETAPPFPFNGDGAKPVETLKRRNLAPNPSFESVDGWFSSGGTPTYSTSFKDRMWGGQTSGSTIAQVDADGSNSYLTLTQNPNTRPTVTPGQWVGAAVFVAHDPSDVLGVRSDVVCSGSATTYHASSYFEPSPFYPGRRIVYAFQVPASGTRAQLRVQMYSGSATSIPAGRRMWVDDAVMVVADTQAEAEAAVATYFDGDTPASGNIVRRWAPDGTSLEVETIQPPTGRTTIWDGEPYKSTSTLWIGDSAHATGVMEISASTDARLGIVADVYSRSREKIQLELARVDSQLIAGERVELDAAAMTASPVVWHWRQITGPAVELEPREASMDFIAPDVDEDTPLRIAVYAASEDGRNRSDWHYFDLTIKPPIARFRATEGAFSPVSPKYVGYDRGKREVWNDVIPPSGFSPSPRHEVEILDLGIVPDDVQFTTGGPPERAAAGGIYVDLETGDIYRNFGAGYNETDDTTAAPRTNAWWVNPATGDILEWIED